MVTWLRVFASRRLSKGSVSALGMAYHGYGMELELSDFFVEEGLGNDCSTWQAVPVD